MSLLFADVFSPISDTITHVYVDLHTFHVMKIYFPLKLFSKIALRFFLTLTQSTDIIYSRLDKTARRRKKFITDLCCTIQWTSRPYSNYKIIR